jgi:hypothetical protein
MNGNRSGKSSLGTSATLALAGVIPARPHTSGACVRL